MIKISKVNIETYIAEILGGVPSQLDNLVQYDIVQQFSIVALQNLDFFSDQIGFGTFNVKTRKWWLYVLHSSMI